MHFAQKANSLSDALSDLVKLYMNAMCLLPAWRGG